ncbi:hypothetical protein D9758_014815 [Tetrapyrgos nigripes]|uniref:Uncharacterized protein n=1 Tax=Tetrapyrgos nigripes TaxID=182062 RepID=A0A8H5C2V1_9AGAR|nr:hypothetical protein D9758_014815 [Tetrapyrgos nigripes]
MFSILKDRFCLQSESTSSSSHLISNSLQGSPAQTSYSFITPRSFTDPSTATSATSSASPDSVTSNPNFASSSHLSNSAHEHIKLQTSPSLSGNMLAVSNTSVRGSFGALTDTYPSFPSQSMTSQPASGMMPQFANFQYYSPNMMMPNGTGMSNPFILAAMIDGSGRSFPLDLSMMQQHMLNPPHSLSRSPSFPGKAIVSGSPYPPPRHHSSKNVNPSQQPGRSSGKNSHIPSSATPSSPVTFRETATPGLRAQRQGQLHIPEAKSSHVTSRGIPHNHRHDKSSRAHPPVTFSLAHTGVNGSKRLSSSSGSLRTPSLENRRLSSSSSDSQSHRYSGSSRHSFGSWSSHQHIVNCETPITPNVSAKPVAAVQTSTSNQPPAALVQASKDSEPLEAASKARDTNVDSADGGKSGSKVEFGDLVEKEGSIMKVDEKGGSTVTVDEAPVSGEVEPEAHVTLGPEAEQSSTTPLSSLALALPPARDDDCDSLSSGVETELTSSTSAVEEEISERCPPTYFPITLFLSKPDLLASLLPRSTMMLTGNELLKEEVLERFLGPVGYSQWTWREPEPISLTLRDLHDYMRCILVPIHEYTRIAESYLKQQKMPQAKRDSDVLQSAVLLRDATRAYNRVLLRIRAQAEKDPDLFMSNSTLRLSCATQSPDPPIQAPNPPLFRLRHAPLLRVFIPSPGGDWLSDSSVQQCEAELKYAEVTKLLRMGDVVWDIAVGDNGNFGRMVWDGQYLIDLDYTYSDVGDVPKYIPSLAFPPSYFHRVLRTNSSSSDPIVRLDISPWGEEIASNLQLLQNKNKGIPQAACHSTNWIHQSSFTIRSPRARSLASKRSEKTGQSSKSTESSHGVPIPGFQGLFVDSGWYGKIVIETEGTGDSLADLQDRCGPGAFPSRVQSSARSMITGRSMQREKDARKVFRIIRERSHPGELWLRAVSSKERRM